MAKASRVAARTAKKIQSLDERLERIELMLEVMLTKKQRADVDALMAEVDDEEPKPEPTAIEQQVAAIHEAMPEIEEAANGEPEKV